jgi:hypothetical protein
MPFIDFVCFRVRGNSRRLTEIVSSMIDIPYSGIMS